MKKTGIILLMVIVGFALFAGENQTEKAETVVADSVQIPQITFLELGSLTCIPCKQMENVLESIREKYGDQIEVIFHDVKKEKEIAEQFRIRMIPTQVFLNSEGEEIHRHIGFYPEAQIDEFLLKQGLIIIQLEE